MASRGVGIGDEDRRAAGGGDLEDRAAGTRQDQVAGGKGVGESGLVGEQRVARHLGTSIEALAQERVVAAAADVEYMEAPFGRFVCGKGVDRAEVDRTGSLAAAEDEQAAVPGRDPEALASRLAIGADDVAGNRASRDQVLLPQPTVDREGEANSLRATGEDAIGETQVAVGFGQHQRELEHDCREPGRAGDVSATAEDRLRPARSQRPPGGGNGASGEPDGAGSAHRVRAVETAKLEEVDLIARGRDELGLGAIARAEEEDRGAFSA